MKVDFLSHGFFGGEGFFLYHSSYISQTDPKVSSFYTKLHIMKCNWNTCIFHFPLKLFNGTWLKWGKWVAYWTVRTLTAQTEMINEGEDKWEARSNEKWLTKCRHLLWQVSPKSSEQAAVGQQVEGGVASHGVEGKRVDSRWEARYVTHLLFPVGSHSDGAP